MYICIYIYIHIYIYIYIYIHTYTYAVCKYLHTDTHTPVRIQLHIQIQIQIDIHMHMHMQIPTDPEIGRAFLSILINFDDQGFLSVVNNAAFSMSTESCLVTFDCEFHWDLVKMCVFAWRKLKKCIKGPSKNVYEKWGHLRFPTAAALLFHHVSLRRVFPVMSYTSVFR